MSNDQNSDEDLDVFLSQLEAALEDGNMESNKRAFALIALGLCLLNVDSFDNEQIVAIEAAHRWLYKGDESDRGHWYNAIAQKIGMDHPLPAKDRIIYSALSRSAGLDGFNAECLAFLGKDIGLTPHQIASVFSEHVPGFNPKL